MKGPTGREANERAARPSRRPLALSATRTEGPPTRQIVGRSQALREVLQRIDRVAVTDSTVLIHGETGTGKELIARAIHEQSRRCSGPFVRLNVAAIPPTLLESEVFGHERGAFTGAHTRRVGRFEEAEEGTIFLDEIGELQPELQPKLLRLLQEREYQRLGGSQTLSTNVRVIVATNRDLGALVQSGQFRADLYYRLNVFPIHAPALRARREDIRLLVQHIVERFARRFDREKPVVAEESLNRLEAYEWPGNVRELENLVERAMILSEGPTLTIGLDETPSGSPEPRPPADELDEVTRAHILRVLDECQWVIAGPTGAAARLGLKRTTLNARLKKLGIERSARRRPPAAIADLHAGLLVSDR
ncbi:MAG TPA: sigma-54 dependent transcriptional regulator [Polyangiaceae bacterium]